MKKFLFIAVITVVALAACKKDDDIRVKGVSLNHTSVTLIAGGIERLVATVSPSDATKKSWTWSTSDSLVAIVSSGGFVTALEVGNAVITVTTDDGNKTATCNITVTEPFSGGDGSSSSPFLITNATDLNTLSNLVNTGNPNYAVDGMWYRLTDNITLTSVPADSTNFTPIGTQTYRFQGNFDGNGKTIDSLIVTDSTDYTGLFGWVRDGTIQNLTLTNVNISGARYTGGITGLIQNWFTNSSITNCYVDGEISGTGEVGGIAGFVGSNSSIMSCFVSGSVSGSSNFVGGIVGYASGIVSNCYTACTVSSKLENVGGIAGRVYNGTVSNCYATGAISGANYCGGIAGSNFGTVSGCVALNPSITRESGGAVSFGRVVGHNISSLNNNAALNNMVADGGISFSDSDINGTAITVAAAKMQSTYSGSPRNWPFGMSVASPWRWGLSSSYPLPTLYWQAAMPILPEHLY